VRRVKLKKGVKKMRHVYVVGVGMTKWGVYPDKEWYDLGSEAMLNALDDAQLEWKDIQAVFAGSVYQ